MIAEDDFVCPFCVLEIFQTFFFVVIRKIAFDGFYSFVARKNCNNLVAELASLGEKIFVAGMKIIKGAEDHDNCFLIGIFHRFGRRILIKSSATRTRIMIEIREMSRALWFFSGSVRESLREVKA